MGKKLPSPTDLLTMRMKMQIPANTEMHFSVLSFPYKKAFAAFTECFADAYKQQYGKEYDFNLPQRQLNDALLMLSSDNLIQGFEGKLTENARMVAFTKLHGGDAYDSPTLVDITNLIRHWLQRWAESEPQKSIVNGKGQAAWQALMDAINGEPETEWKHNISPVELLADINHENGLSFVALPSLLSSLLHDRKTVIEREGETLELTWRRVNEGGTHGLHLVSQPLPYHEDYFAYRLDFFVQTQTGYVNEKGKLKAWIFAKLSVQRYISQAYKHTDKKRAVSILVGRERERFSGDSRSTLIRLPVKFVDNKLNWRSGVGQFLNDFGLRRMASPEELQVNPRQYAAYDRPVPTTGDEHYIIYAEGRKFTDEFESDKKARRHKTPTGFALKEIDHVMAAVLSALDGWLATSPPLKYDSQNPENTFALRDYDYMTDDDRVNNEKQDEAWRQMLQGSLSNSDYSRVHIIVLHRSANFREWVKPQVEDALMGADSGDDPLASVDYVPLESILYAPLEAEKSDTKLLREAYCAKRDQWRKLLQSLPWKAGARRLLLIDSTGEGKVDKPLKIKGAIRDACNREGINSQFLVGDALKIDTKSKVAGTLTGQSRGSIKNAVTDLMLRQQGILYGEPHEIYTKAAGLGADIAQNLDVIAFSRLQGTKPIRFYYAVAVRLRANGAVDVMFPQGEQWIPYDLASQLLGKLVSGERVKLVNTYSKDTSPLRMSDNQLLDFAHKVLTEKLEAPTIAVIEAEGWRNARGFDESKHGWKQLQNGKLADQADVLAFDKQRIYKRNSPIVENLMAVVRVRQGDETPQYITAGAFLSEGKLRDMPHLTGYVDQVVSSPLHYMSVAGLTSLQDKQTEKPLIGAFKQDIKPKYHDIAIKHPQIIEFVPFFLRPDFQSDEGARQICRCVHFLRNSPSFTTGEISLPYPMHLGEKLIEDQLCIVYADE